MAVSDVMIFAKPGTAGSRDSGVAAVVAKPEVESTPVARYGLSIRRSYSILDWCASSRRAPLSLDGSRTGLVAVALQQQHAGAAMQDMPTDARLAQAWSAWGAWALHGMGRAVSRLARSPRQL